MSSALLLTNATVIDGTGTAAQPHSSVLVRGHTIQSVGTNPHIDDGTEIVDLGGRTVLPGFFDCHVHFAFGPATGVLGPTHDDPVLAMLAAVRRMEDTLAAGVTTVRDLCGLPVGYRTAIESGRINGPRLQVALKALSHTGGHGDGHRCGVNTTAHMSELVDTVDETRLATRRLIRDGADVIKVCASGGMSSTYDDPDDEGLTEAEMSAVLDEARRHRGLPVAAHAQGERGILAALRAGVTSLEHGYAITDEGCDLALENGTILVPTLRTALHPPNRNTMPEKKYQKKLRWLDIARENIARAIERGVTIAVGTDAGICSHGGNLEELGLLVELGMKPMDAIVAGTRTSAELLRLGSEVGTIEPGKIADIIVVDGDPTTDIGVLGDNTRIQAVMTNGRWRKNELGPTHLDSAALPGAPRAN